MRLRSLVLVLGFILVVYPTGPVYANTLPIVRDGEAQAIIVTGDQVAYRIRQAAQIFNDYVEQSTGARLEVMTTSAYEVQARDYADYTRLYIDNIPSQYETDIAEGLLNLDDQGFLIYPRGQTITIQGPGIWGTLHGVYDFLERFVGVRWLMLGPVGEDVPTQANIDVPMTDIREQPAFTYRALARLFSGADPYIPLSNTKIESEWAHRNKLQGRYNFEISFGHNLHRIFPPEKFGETNAEFYPRGIPPDPGDNMRWQPCFSVPETVDVAVDYIVDYFNQNPNVISFSLGVNDIGGHCEEHPSHPAYTGKRNTSNYMDMSDIYYGWVNQVVERVTEVHSDKWFPLYAYREVMDPPSFSLHPQVIPNITKDRMTWIDDEIRAIGHSQMEAWSEVASQVAWYDYMWGIAYQVPRVYPRLMAEIFQYGSENNVFGPYISDLYYAGEGPKIWILAKLLWDPHQDIEALLQDWYERAVGPEAAGDLAAYFDHWEHFWTERIPQTAWFAGSKANIYLQFPDQSYMEHVTEEDIAQSIEWLDSVVEKAQTEQQKARANVIREAFDFYEASALSYPKETMTPSNDESALMFVDDLLRIMDQRIDMAERRYDLRMTNEYSRPKDRNLWIRTKLEDYWWNDWTGWNTQDLDRLVSYLTAYEPMGGVVTDRLKTFRQSDDPLERRLAYFVKMAEGAFVKAPSLTKNSSFENDGAGLSSWTVYVEGKGTVDRSQDVAFMGSGSLLFQGVGHGSVSQVFELTRGLTGVQVHYYTPSAAQKGTIQITLEGLNSAGDVLATVSTPRRSLEGYGGTWSSLELIDALSPGLRREAITEGRIMVTIDGVSDGQVYIDEVVVYQQFPAGAEVVDVEKVDRLPNLVLGKTVQASSEAGRNIADNAVDGDLLSRWLTARGAESPHWLEIDLQGTFVLDSAEVWSGTLPPADGPYSIAHMQLQYWQDGQWKDIPGASVSNNRAQVVYFDFAEPILTDKVRFYSETPAAPDGEGLRFREILVYGLPEEQASMLSSRESTDTPVGTTSLRDFSGRRKSDGYPVGWEGMLGGEVVGDIVFFELDPETDQWKLNIVKESRNGRFAVVSERIAIEPGVEYIALTEARAEVGVARFFLEYLDNDGRRISAHDARTGSGEWEMLAVTRLAPEGAVWARVFMYAQGGDPSTTYYRSPELTKY